MLFLQARRRRVGAAFMLPSTALLSDAHSSGGIQGLSAGKACGQVELFALLPTMKVLALLLLTSRKTHPPFPPFDGCKPTLSPVTLYIS